MFDDILEEFILIINTSVKETQQATPVKKILSKIQNIISNLFLFLIVWLVFSYMSSHGENREINPESLLGRLIVISIVVLIGSYAISIALFVKEYIFKENGIRRKSFGRSKADTFLLLELVLMIVLATYNYFSKRQQPNDPIVDSICFFIVIIAPLFKIFSVVECDENMINIDNNLWKTIDDRTKKC